MWAGESEREPEKLGELLSLDKDNTSSHDLYGTSTFTVIFDLPDSLARWVG